MVKRYDVETVDRYDMVESKDGMWVMFDDIQAVREAVIEECAKVCDQVANEVWNNTRSEHWSDEFELLAHNIRLLKDKK